MKRRKNTGAKIMAFFALFAIIVGIIGTALIFIISAFFTPQQDTLTEADLQKIIESFSGTELEATPETTP